MYTVLEVVFALMIHKDID